MYISGSRPGQIPFQEKRMRVVNRCGSTTLQVGDVVALDLDASDTATQNRSGVGGVTLSSLTEAMFHNVVEVAGAPVNAIIGVVTSLLSGRGEDDTEVEIAIGGRVQAKVGGTDWSSARASCGIALMADTTGGNRRLVAATDGASTGKVGLIIEDIGENLSSGTDSKQLTEVLLNGWGSSVGSVGA